jgi:metal-responsive CopG/Arc/MetJ family transcriptional regulator
MTRTTVTLPPELLKKTKRAAAERDLSMAEFIRRALEDALEEYPRRFKSAGILASGETDLAARSADMKFEPPPWRS